MHLPFCACASGTISDEREGFLLVGGNPTEEENPDDLGLTIKVFIKNIFLRDRNFGKFASSAACNESNE